MARYRKYNKRYDYNPGYERAKQHIREAHALSEELGGTDKDVKDYFFSLPHESLNQLLIKYGKQYGSDAEEYARKTINKWKTGSVQMSGMVAEREGVHNSVSS